MMNFTMDKKLSQSLAEELCFPATVESQTNELVARVFLSVFNIIFSITAVLGNVLIFIAFHKESSFHPPSKLLFRCLAATDLFFGLITQPTFAIYQLSIVTKSLDICHIAGSISHITTMILCGVSLATMTAISVDRLLALQLKMRYRQVVTLKRVRLTVVFICLQNITVSLLVYANKRICFYLHCLAISLNIVISTFCYLKILITLRFRTTQVQEVSQSQSQSQAEPNSVNQPQSGTRYKKTVSSALIFHLGLIACYVPFVVVRSMIAMTGEKLFVSEAVVVSLVYLNSSLNPLFYCWKIKEIRHELKQMVRETCCP